MIEKIKTVLWFAPRPDYWAHACELGLRKLRPNRDNPQLAESAKQWASDRVCTVSKALHQVSLLQSGDSVPAIPRYLIDIGNQKAARSAVRMGGAADLTLLYAAVKSACPKRLIETGVAYGWSSLAILTAISGIPDARLVSVDMPYPKLNNDSFIGIVVPDHLRAAWSLIREPDRHGLEKAIARFGGTIDFCHYDSDKSYWGRRYAYPLLWDALTPGGIFMSDDIQDNNAFAEFVNSRRLRYAVTHCDGKFVGITRKPSVALAVS